MKSLNPELTLYGSNNLCTWNNTVLPTISEVSTKAVSLQKSQGFKGSQQVQYSLVYGCFHYFFQIGLGGSVNAGEEEEDGPNESFNYLKQCF